MKDRAENIRKVIEYLMADCHVCHQMPSSLEERQRMMRALMNVWEPRDISPEFLAMQDAGKYCQLMPEIAPLTPQNNPSRPHFGGLRRTHNWQKRRWG